MTDDDGSRVAAAMREIFAELPAKLGIRAILIDAHARLTAATDGHEPGIVGQAAAQAVVADRLAEVLREIATIAVQEFTKRTGQPFEWVDEPEFEATEDNTIAAFALDAKGNVIFDTGGGK